MPVPIVVEDLFEHGDWDMTVHDEHVIIDNYYKNYDDIVELFEHMPVESWKMSKWTRNWKDYYDCRPAFNNWEPDLQKRDKRLKALNDLIYKFTGAPKIEVEKTLSFNVFKHKKKDVPNHMQHHPHYDVGMVNVLTYIDPHCSGGTAIYTNTELENKEGATLLMDIRPFNIDFIIPAKPNRTVLFDGNALHGAYIEDNNVYYDNWRITQASICRLKYE